MEEIILNNIWEPPPASTATAARPAHSQPLPEDLVEGAGVVNSVKLVVGANSADILPTASRNGSRCVSE